MTVISTDNCNKFGLSQSFHGPTGSFNMVSSGCKDAHRTDLILWITYQEHLPYLYYYASCVLTTSLYLLLCWKFGCLW
jgi:hypothetical protein